MNKILWQIDQYEFNWQYFWKIIIGKVSNYTENAESINNTQLVLNVHKELKTNRIYEFIMLINCVHSIYDRMVAGSRSKLRKIKTIRLILYVYNILVYV